MLFNINNFIKHLYYDEDIVIPDNIISEVSDNFNFLEEFAKGKIIYGINTGFGPMSQHKIEPKDLNQLQYNLIRSHCTGSGIPIPQRYVKSAMICRLLSLCKAKSGIHPDAILLLRDMINNNIIPVVYSHGSVGASGDLVQLAHIALTMIGEGEVFYENKVMKTEDAFKKCKLKPIKVHIREGLSLINGTSVMTGIAVVNIIHARNLINLALYLSAMVNELVESFDDTFSQELNCSKLHYGQKHAAHMVSNILHDSKLLKKRDKSLYKKNNQKNEIISERVQEYYSLRCFPQVLGPIIDTIEYAEKVIINEANSSNDNPVVDTFTKTVYHGCNFHGDYISLEMDKVKICMTKLSMLIERQLNFLLNPKLNERFPAFLNLGKLGLNLGMQAMQFTATSTTAENQTLSFPNYVHSIPNNLDNQDIVSMGTNSALLAQRVINNTYEIMSIYVIAVLQAYRIVDKFDKMASATLNFYKEFDQIAPVFIEDTTKYDVIRIVTDYLKNQSLHKYLATIV